MAVGLAMLFSGLVYHFGPERLKYLNSFWITCCELHKIVCRHSLDSRLRPAVLPETQ